MAGAAVAVLVVSSALVVLFLAVAPQRVPLHYGPGWVPDRWGTRAGLAAVEAVVLGLSWLLVAIGLRIRDPVSGLVLSVAAAGLALLAVSTAALAAPAVCPQAWGPGG